MSIVSGEIEGDEPVIRVAYFDDDQAQFTAEGDEVPEGEPPWAEQLVHTAKVTQLIRLSNEQYLQANTGAQLSASVRAPSPGGPTSRLWPSLHRLAGPSCQWPGSSSQTTWWKATTRANHSTRSWQVKVATGTPVFQQ